MDRRALVLPAPGKLNLFLHVTGRRADGYHELETLFQFVDRCDRVTLELRADGRLQRTRPLPGVAARDDLCLRAARLLRDHLAAAPGADIEVRKRLPMGGGLGGGSSDAAAVLLGLNRLWGGGLDQAALAELGLELGADVPVFVRGRSAYARGVGERLQPLDLPCPWYLIAVPSRSVPTASVFAAPALTRDSAPLTISRFPFDTRAAERDFAGLVRLWTLTRNDCEAVVRAANPEVAAALDWLGAYAPARLTGTGACVFAAFEDEASARRIEARKPAGLGVFVARGLNRSPLHEVLAAA